MLNNNSITYPNIRAKMAYYGYTKTKLQSALCVSFPTLDSKLKGKADWKSSELLTMAEIFNCSVDELLKS
jgi:hypothetical protein